MFDESKLPFRTIKIKRGSRRSKGKVLVIEDENLEKFNAGIFKAKIDIMTAEEKKELLELKYVNELKKYGKKRTPADLPYDDKDRIENELL